MKAEQYITIRESDFKAFDASVTRKLAEGWELWGSPYIVEGSEFLICQALAKPAR
jgi:hypothetical protein